VDNGAHSCNGSLLLTSQASGKPTVVQKNRSGAVAGTGAGLPAAQV